MSEPLTLADSTSIPTPHNEAKYGDFAETVIMPGDPLRSKLIAEDFLEDAKLVNNVRGIQGYTGKWKDKKVSVMASGMGQPSMGIYSYELYAFYGVKNIIRIGTAGSLSSKLHLGDLIIAQATCTETAFPSQYELPGGYSPIADWDLCRFAVDIASEKGYTFEVGNIVSSDRFYAPKEYIEDWAQMNVKGYEMETAALYCNAAYLKKRAIAICSVSNSFVYPEENMSAEERQNSVIDMINLSLDLVLKTYELD